MKTITSFNYIAIPVLIHQTSIFHYSMSKGLNVIAFIYVLQIVTGFTPINHVTNYRYPKNSGRDMVATVENIPIPKSEDSPISIAWECDDDANCVAVPACDEVSCRTSLDVRIHGKWYDLSGKLSVSFVCETMLRS